MTSTLPLVGYSNSNISRGSNYSDSGGTVSGVRIATMHRVKGLEFRYVMVVAVKDGTVPLAAAMRQTDDPVVKSC